MPRKRIYLPFAVYHVTMNPKYRLPQFREDIFCYILVTVIVEGAIRKGYFLIGYKINPEHVHILLQCRDKYNISEVVHHIKRNSSILINMLRTKDTEDERVYFKWTRRFHMLHDQLVAKYGTAWQRQHPLFYWQPGFHDVIIRSRSHLEHAMLYLKKQSDIHALQENHYCYVTDHLPAGINYPRHLKSKLR